MPNSSSVIISDNIFQFVFSSFYSLLSIVDYRDDKKQFTNDFLELCVLKTIINLIEHLPAWRKEEVKNTLLKEKDIQKKIQSLTRYFKLDEIKTEFKNAIIYLLNDYVTTIQASLSPNQKQRATAYIKTITEVIWNYTVW